MIIIIEKTIVNTVCLIFSSLATALYRQHGVFQSETERFISVTVPP